MATLIPRPAVKRVNRVVVLPKALHRPQPGLKVLPKKTLSVNPSRRAIGAGVARGARAATKLSAPKLVVSTRPKRIVDNNRKVSVTWRGKEKEPDSVTNPANLAGIASLRECGVGRSLIIVGNGPSVSEVDLTPLANHDKIDIMSINKPVNSIWPTKYWLFCDITQYSRHRHLWDEYGGISINTKAVHPTRPKGIKVRNLSGVGFCTNLVEGVHVGQSSVYVAMQVAAWMEYDNVYIFGIDMTGITKDGVFMTHFFGINPDVSPDIRTKRFDKEAKHYEHAAERLSADRRARYVFCSSYNPYQFVNRFRRLDHKIAVQTILQSVN